MIFPYRIAPTIIIKETKRHWKCILFGHNLKVISWIRFYFVRANIKPHPAIGMKCKCTRCDYTFDDTNYSIKSVPIEENVFIKSPGILLRQWQVPKKLSKRLTYNFNF